MKICDEVGKKKNAATMTFLNDAAKKMPTGKGKMPGLGSGSDDGGSGSDTNGIDVFTITSAAKATVVKAKDRE